MLVLFLVVVLVFVLVSCCCHCLHRLHCRVADATDATIDTKHTVAIAVTIAPAVTAVITNAIALTPAIAAFVASAVVPCCNYYCLAVAVAEAEAVAVAVVRVAVRLVAVAVAAAAAVAMSGHWRRRTCAALVERRWSDNNASLSLRCSDWLALLGLLCSAHVKVRPLTRWLALRTCIAG
jgi:hypothetical protein